METARIKPMVNQLEFHPGYMQPDNVKASQDNDMLVEAWSPLGSGAVLNDPTLKEIAGKYGVTVAQLCVRWCLQLGVLPLPRSTDFVRIKQNAEVFGFEISADDMDFISAMPQTGYSGMNPTEVDF